MKRLLLALLAPSMGCAVFSDPSSELSQDCEDLCHVLKRCGLLVSSAFGVTENNCTARCELSSPPPSLLQVLDTARSRAEPDGDGDAGLLWDEIGGRGACDVVMSSLRNSSLLPAAGLWTGRAEVTDAGANTTEEAGVAGSCTRAVSAWWELRPTYGLPQIAESTDCNSAIRVGADFPAVTPGPVVPLLHFRIPREGADPLCAHVAGDTQLISQGPRALRNAAGIAPEKVKALLDLVATPESVDMASVDPCPETLRTPIATDARDAGALSVTSGEKKLR